MRETHGMTGTREYRAWRDAKARCYRKSHPMFANYGGRGIEMCVEWVCSFSAFHAELGFCPEGLSLDRIDNSKGYEPNNCRWASKETQVRNQRIRGDNKTGVKGVHYSKQRENYQVHAVIKGRNKTIGTRKDFFEAVCVRKAHEARERGEMP